MSLITLEPDMSIDPGHQWLVMPTTDEGAAIAKLLTGSDHLWDYCFVDQTYELGLCFRIPHTNDVDKNIVQLIDQLAHVRFSAPGLVQLTLQETAQESQG